VYGSVRWQDDKARIHVAVIQYFLKAFFTVLRNGVNSTKQTEHNCSVASGAVS
jgi:hypothetical protein